MRFSKAIYAGLAVVLASAAAMAVPGTTAPKILPEQFSGWQISGTPVTSTDPAVADPANAALLREYGLTDFEGATYTREDRKLKIKVARFADASGSYGAFTYYKLQPMLAEQIGDQSGSLNERVLFYRGNFLVDAVFDQLTAMSAAELRNLASALPRAIGNTQNLPGLPGYLPRQQYVKNTAKYVMGPVGLMGIGGVLPPEMVDFAAGAEVAMGEYTTDSGTAKLMLISYPTPQIAAAHLKRIDAARQQNENQPSSVPALGTIPLFDKRTGPIVAVVAGTVSPDDAKALLAKVNYQADVTWNENTHLNEGNNLGKLIWNAVVLGGILIGFAVVAGIAFGGARIILARVIPGRFFDRPEAVEFISLHLGEKGRDAEDRL